MCFPYSIPQFHHWHHIWFPQALSGVTPEQTWSHLKLCFGSGPPQQNKTNKWGLWKTQRSPHGFQNILPEEKWGKDPLTLTLYAWRLHLFIYFNLGPHLDILRIYSWLFVKRSLQARLWVLYGYQGVNSVWPLARQRPYHYTYYLILCVVSSLMERFWIYKVDLPANWIDNSVPKCWKECPFMSLNECCKSKWWTWFYKWPFMTYLILSPYSPQRTHHSVWARAYSLW